MWCTRTWSSGTPLTFDCFFHLIPSMNLMPLMTSANRLNPRSFRQPFSALHPSLQTMVSMVILLTQARAFGTLIPIRAYASYNLSLRQVTIANQQRSSLTICHILILIKKLCQLIPYCSWVLKYLEELNRLSLIESALLWHPLHYKQWEIHEDWAMCLAMRQLWFSF